MSAGQPRLPLIWLLSDERNDAWLEGALANLPPHSGFVFRHYHLGPDARRSRFETLKRIAQDRGHSVVVSGDSAGLVADGVYGAPGILSGASGLRMATAHDGDEIRRAIAEGADGIFLSPVFPTRSHPRAATLGVHGFHVLAQQSTVPVIALGGLTERRAWELDWPRWGAIDAFAVSQES